MKQKNKILMILIIGIAVIAAALFGISLHMLKKAENTKQQVTEAAVEVIEKTKEEEASASSDADAEASAAVTAAAGSAGVEFTDIEETVYVVAEQANLRSQPNEEGEVLETVSMSTLLKRTGTSGEWSRVTRNGRTCYVANELVSTEMPDVATDASNVDQDTGEDDADADTADSSDSDTAAATTTSQTGKIVIIDPGHQGHGDSTQEAIGPGSSQTKARVTSGTSGCVSGLDEYQLNLIVSLQLREELESRGYTVYMTRETHDVDISNKERAEFATAHNGDIMVRIHANGSDDSSVNGALTMAPSGSNPFLSSDLIAQSQSLSQYIIDAYCAATGFNSQGVYQTDEMSGINWSTMPVTIVEMGYMSNPTDDANMADAAMEKLMVAGIANGIDAYFGS